MISGQQDNSFKQHILCRHCSGTGIVGSLDAFLYKIFQPSQQLQPTQRHCRSYCGIKIFDN